MHQESNLKIQSKFGKFCKIFSKNNIIRTFCSRFENQKLMVATYHLFEKYSLLPEEIYCTAFVSFILTIMVSLFLFILFGSILLLIAGCLMAYLLQNYIVTKLINEFEQKKLNILRFVELIFHEFLIILSTTKSIFDAIYFISQGKYPYISKKFREMVWAINLGADPETQLYTFAINQPSESLRERILSVLATEFAYDAIIEELEKNVLEKEMEYEKFTKELDTKFVLLIGFSTFIPLLFIILIILSGWQNSYWVFSFPLFYFLLLNFFKRNFIKSKFLIFGSLESKLNKKNEKKRKNIKLEFENLLIFLTYFGNFLNKGNCVERALINSIQEYKGSLKNKLQLMLNNILFKNQPFITVWDNFADNLTNYQSIQILNTIKRMLQKDSIITGSQIISMITQLKKNQNLIKKRELIYKSQQFKIQIISILSSCVLGLFSSLAPIFGIALSLTSFDQKFLGIYLKFINYFEYLPLLITMISVLIISSYTLADIIKLSNPKKIVFTSLFLFGVSWYLSYIYLFSYL